MLIIQAGPGEGGGGGGGGLEERLRPQPRPQRQRPRLQQIGSLKLIMTTTTMILMTILTSSKALTLTTPMHPPWETAYSSSSSSSKLETTEVRVFADAETGSVAFKFPRLDMDLDGKTDLEETKKMMCSGKTTRTLVPADSEAFFIANGQTDLVVGSDLRKYTGKILYRSSCKISILHILFII